MNEARETGCEPADWLRRIAHEVRSLGDVPLVLLSDDGVGPAGITLADELELVALQVDEMARGEAQ